MNEKNWQLIFWCLNEIDVNQNWLPFEDLILNNVSHPAQNQFLSKSVFRENGLHAGNGWGKTSVIAKKHLKFILKHFAKGKKYKTLNASLTQDQSELVQDEIVSLVENSPILKGWLISSVVKFPKARIFYSNGAMTEFKTTKKKGESIEGKEYGYISADDIALELYLEFIREKILLPRTRKYRDSQLDFFATPKGKNAYYRVLEDIKRHGGHVQGGSSYDNPHIDHTLLDYICSNKSQSFIDQTIKGMFLNTSEMMFASRVEKLFDEKLRFEECEKGAHYVEGWDLARGRKKNADQTVGIRLKDLTEYWQVVKRWAFQLPWTEKERENILAELAPNEDAPESSIEREIRQAHYESDARVLLDSTGVGDTLYGMVQDIAEPVDFRGGRKDDLLEHLQAVIDAGLVKAPFIAELADEMTTYQREDKLLDTDNLMALAIACWSISVETVEEVQLLDSELLRV
jgi:hypothetical protein